MGECSGAPPRLHSEPNCAVVREWGWKAKLSIDAVWRHLDARWRRSPVEAFLQQRADNSGYHLELPRHVQPRACVLKFGVNLMPICADRAGFANYTVP